MEKAIISTRKVKEIPEGTVRSYLTVISELGRAIYSGKQCRMFLLRCVCGKEVELPIHRFYYERKESTKSCGCVHFTKDGQAILKHDGCGTRLYSKWLGMKDRCENPKNQKYPRYGARGILVCEEWQSFIPFQDWAIKNAYIDGVGLTIERKDIDKGYNPDNCEFIHYSKQAHNTSRNIFATINGETKCVSEWCRIFNINTETVNQRRYMGWGLLESITTPVKREKRYMRISPSKARMQRQRLDALTLFDQKNKEGLPKSKAVSYVSEVLGVSLRLVYSVIKRRDNGQEI